MRNQENVKKYVEERLKQFCGNEVKIADAYFQFKDELMEILSDLESMWGGYLGEINVAKKQIELYLADAKQIHSAPYREGLKSRKFEKKKIEKMLSDKVIE